MTRNRPGSRMRRLRPIVFERDNGVCVVCGGWLSADWECHHRRFKSRGGKDELANLIACCPACHHQIHSRGTWATEHGFAVSQFGPPPWEIPVRYWDRRLVSLSNEIEVAA